MKYLKLFEEYAIKSHLKGRGVDPDKTRVIIDEETEDVYFYLYNLSGQLIGYQKYNPNYEKIGQTALENPRMAKYFNWVTDEYKGKKIAVWGLESFDIMKDKYVFIVEGIFDAARIHEAGYPALAMLCNDPSDQVIGWLDTLPQKKIVIYDNDLNRAGNKLIKIGDYAYTVHSGKDINDLEPKDAKIFIEECLKKSGF